MNAALSLGFMGLFGRSWPLRAFDKNLRAFDLHPKLVPEAIKLAAMRLLMESKGGREPSDDENRDAAALLAYCMLGEEIFSAVNGPEISASIEARIDAALVDGDTTDAKLILLALHANVIQAGVLERYGLEASSS